MCNLYSLLEIAAAIPTGVQVNCESYNPGLRLTLGECVCEKGQKLKN